MLILNTLLFNPKLMSYTQNENFIPICTFLSDHQDCTLREMKQAFPLFDNMEKFIDPLITAEIIQRHHGRYRLKQAKLSVDLQESIVKEVKILCEQSSSHFKNWLEENDYFSSLECNETKVFAFVLALAEALISEEPFYFFEQSSHLDRWQDYPLQLKMMQGHRDKWLTLDTFNPNYQASVVDYFNLLKLPNYVLPKELQLVYQRIGDVNPHYFLEYTERKLRRLFKNKKVPTTTPDIFMTALFEMGYVKIKNEEYQPHLLKLNSKELWTKPSFLNKFEKTWQTIYSDQISLGAWNFMVTYCLYDYFKRTFDIGVVTKRHALYADL
ncbi:DUF1803 domain-containing protein [Vagococcus sp.]|uniref:DUF1803 domain-containing protein n=1 Tax=Vagococcus sp. TaxID=1933889 RepID=UPI003F95E896